MIIKTTSGNDTISTKIHTLGFSYFKN